MVGAENRETALPGVLAGVERGAATLIFPNPDWQQSARRLVDILITGSRPS